MVMAVIVSGDCCVVLTRMGWVLKMDPEETKYLQVAVK